MGMPSALGETLESGGDLGQLDFDFGKAGPLGDGADARGMSEVVFGAALDFCLHAAI